MWEDRSQRHRTEMTIRLGPELNPGQRQNRTNKSQGGGMLRAGWKAEQAKQGTEWEATQKDLCCRNNCKTEQWRSRRYDGGQGLSEVKGQGK